jgi:hypothetical protein
LPAKGYLNSVLRKTRAVLRVDPSNRTGNYWRLLSVLEVKGHNINLALIKKGHGYFLTLVTPGRRISKLMREQRRLHLKNNLEYRVFEIHANDIDSVCAKNARPFIRAVISTLSQK